MVLMRILKSMTTLYCSMAAVTFAVARASEPFDDARERQAEDLVSFIQSHSSLKPGQLLADTTSLAQTAVGKAIAHLHLAGSPPQADVQPAWDTSQEFDDEEHGCAKEGLSPGVCAISALARAESQPQGTLDELDFFNPIRLERALFQELEAALTGTHSSLPPDHLRKIEEELADLYASLPKNANGFLDHATVKYATHQRFLRTRAWYVRSFNPVGEAQAPASPGEALRGQVPQHLQRLLEERQAGRGLGLRELAALVATLDHLIQGDLSERLKAAYAVHGLKASGMTPRLDVADAMKTYIAHFLSLRHKSGYALTPQKARKERHAIEVSYPGWSEILSLISASLKKRAPDLWTQLPFSEAVEAAHEVMEKYSAISAQDCLEIKKDMSELPDGSTGKVRVRDMHQKALQESSLFAESTEYLRLTGALEETADGDARVLLPNYVYGPSNCLGTTSFFDMCCPNECESLLQRLEGALHKPSVLPEEVERTLGPLPGIALGQLEQLVASRGSAVPLHGYQFSLWLHNSFPSICPKPRHADFQGARSEEDVPDAGVEFQAVAELPAIAATTSDLKAELAANTSQVAASSSNSHGDLHLSALKALAADKLASKGLKLSSGFDGSSLAQTAVSVSADTEDQDSAREPSGPSLV